MSTAADRVELQFQAEEAWKKYASTVQTAGSAAEREHAYAEASAAHEKLRQFEFEAHTPVLAK